MIVCVIIDNKLEYECLCACVSSDICLSPSRPCNSIYIWYFSTLVFLAFQLLQAANTSNYFIFYYCKNSIQRSGEIKKLLLYLIPLQQLVQKHAANILTITSLWLFTIYQKIHEIPVGR